MLRKTKTNNSVTMQDLLVWDKPSNHTSSKVEWDGEPGKACRETIEARLAKSVGEGNRHHKKSRVVKRIESPPGIAECLWE